MKIKYLFITIISALIIVSCGSGKQVADVTGDDYIPADRGMSQRQLDTLFRSLQHSYGAWTDVKIPVKLHIRSPKQFSIGGTMTMVSGKSISISLKFFGMEVAQLAVTNDSVYAFYKMDKVYFAEDLASLMGDFPVTVGNIQNLIMGRAFRLGDRRLEISNCSLAGYSNAWIIAPGDAPHGMSYEFAVSMPANRVSSMSINIPSRQPIVAYYTDMEMTLAGVVSGLTTIKAATSKTELEASIELNLGKAEWNEGDIKSWKAPKGYRRVSKEDVMKLLNAIRH